MKLNWTHQKQIGLGDAVKKIANPVAILIDGVFQTELKNCKSCAERAALWNKKFPDITKIL